MYISCILTIPRSRPRKMAAASVECVDFLEFQDTLRKMRQFDDKIIYMLNTTLPTESFKGEVNPTSKCKELYEEVQHSHIQRESAINKCLIIAKERVKHLKNQKENQGNDPIFIKSLRKEQNNLRLLQSELGVEEVLRNRTMQAYHDRCRSYYKPPTISP